MQRDEKDHDMAQTRNTVQENIVYDIIIIGAGASGLFAGATLDRHAPRRLILEKTGRIGTKLLMSGSGQCNITHGGTIKDFISCYGEKGKAIRSILYKYNNRSLMDFLNKNGIPTFVRDDGKVFPVSMQARDVLEMLVCRAKENGFQICCNSPVTKIQPMKVRHIDGQIKNAHGKGALWQLTMGTSANTAATVTAHNVIIATGGCSYPGTGSDGSFFEVLQRDLALRVTPLHPSLSAIQVKDYPYESLSGISFEKVRVSILPEGTEGCREKAGSVPGEALLFTHKDFSGPAILNLSKYASKGDHLQINYVWPMRYEEALDRLKTIMHGAKGSPANIIASEFDLPKRFCQLLCARVGHSLKSLARSLTGERFSISSVGGFDRAMATSGGIDLPQLDLSTMAFKDHPGLYAIGEALDVDGITGGYNLQFAYSSAHAAAAHTGGNI